MTRSRFADAIKEIGALPIQRVASLVPAALGSNLQRLPRPLTFGLVGPFNNQRRRQAAVEAIFAAMPFSSVVETGTHRALTTLYLRSITDAPIATIEVNPRYHEDARRRIGATPGISALLGESTTVLGELRQDPDWTGGPAFFYLDAHWLDHLPLVEELRLIAGGWQDFVALVDDFEVPGDRGYGHDDYGPEKKLARPLIDVPELSGLHLYWPVARSHMESGARRGWAVVCSPGMAAAALDGLAELRPDGVLGLPAGTVTEAFNGDVRPANGGANR